MAGRQRWAWHRLDSTWARRIVRDAEIQPGQHVVDLGAGDGALTLPLLAAGARVTAIELHRGRTETLRRRASRASPDHSQNLRVVTADVRTAPLPRRPFRVVANPPFALTAALLARLTHRRSAATELRLVLQRAVVRDLAAAPPPRWRVVDAANIPRSAFTPRPVVDIAVVTMRRR